MPDKATFEKFVGKFCVEQAEIARPKIEQIVKEAADIEEVLVKPRQVQLQQSYPPNYYTKPREQITIGAWSKYGDSFGWPDITPHDANIDESFADCMIRLVKDVMETARSGGALT